MVVSVAEKTRLLEPAAPDETYEMCYLGAGVWLWVRQRED